MQEYILTENSHVMWICQYSLLLCPLKIATTNIEVTSNMYILPFYFYMMVPIKLLTNATSCPTFTCPLFPNATFATSSMFRILP